MAYASADSDCIRSSGYDTLTALRATRVGQMSGVRDNVRRGQSLRVETRYGDEVENSGRHHVDVNGEIFVDLQMLLCCNADCVE